jgi:hypothetical protein
MAYRKNEIEKAEIEQRKTCNWCGREKWKTSSETRER